MNEKKTTESREAKVARYEQMARDLYRYQIGTISFSELLTGWEQMLGIIPAPHENREKECISTTKGIVVSPPDPG